VEVLDHNFATELTQHSGRKLAAMPRFLGGTISDDQCPPPQSVPAGAGALLRENVESIAMSPSLSRTSKTAS